jgi:hypothetical protein
MSKISEVLSSQVKDKRVIGFMVLKGFGTFVIVTGLVGLSFILGPLNLIVKFDYTIIFGNTVYAVVFCFLLCVIGGALEFLSDAFIKYLSSDRKNQ